MGDAVQPYRVSEIIVASSNLNKICELTNVGAEFGIRLLTENDLEGKGKPPQVQETGKTYRENAVLKAAAYCRWSGMVALGDDSGLEVRGLNNEPGLLSARYGGEEADDHARVRKVLSRLEQVKSLDRSARYRCSLALYYPNEATLYSDSEVSGVILEQPRGDRGFGYDPIFYLESLQKTYAELEFESVVKSGFRAIAARALFEQLQKLPSARVKRERAHLRIR